jgi:hypothetical protein
MQRQRPSIMRRCSCMASVTCVHLVLCRANLAGGLFLSVANVRCDEQEAKNIRCWEGERKGSTPLCQQDREEGKVIDQGYNAWEQGGTHSMAMFNVTRMLVCYCLTKEERESEMLLFHCDLS